MSNFINYINTTPMQAAGRIIFLLSLALIFGSSLLAFISELTYKSKNRADYPVRCHNITRSAWIWIILSATVGGTIIFLPQTAVITQSASRTSAGISSIIAILLFLLYHFTSKIIKIKLLHAPLALFAAAAAKIAALFWFLPGNFVTGFDNQPSLAAVNKLLAAWLQSGVIVNFVHFLLNAVAISALIFMLANAKEKEKKRRQPREYYFKASNFAGKWLLAAVTLQILPVGWLFYNFSIHAPQVLFKPPVVYWFAGLVLLFILGWLLLIKINRDGLVNRRATFIIGLFFSISLCLFHFGPFGTLTKTAAQTTKPAATAVKPETKVNKTQNSQPQPDPQSPLKSTATPKTSTENLHPSTGTEQ